MSWWKSLVRAVLRGAPLRRSQRRASARIDTGEAAGACYRVDSVQGDPPALPPEWEPILREAQPDPHLLGRVLAKQLAGRACAASRITGGSVQYLVTAGPRHP